PTLLKSNVLTVAALMRFSPPASKSAGGGGGWKPSVPSSVMPLPLLPAIRLSWMVIAQPHVVAMPSLFGRAADAAAFVPIVLSLIRIVFESKTSTAGPALPEMRLLVICVRVELSTLTPPRDPFGIAALPAELVPI